MRPQFGAFLGCDRNSLNKFQSFLAALFFIGSVVPHVISSFVLESLVMRREALPARLTAGILMFRERIKPRCTFPALPKTENSCWAIATVKLLD
jgi:hypothetical protein